MPDFDRRAADEHLRWAYGSGTGYMAMGLLNRDTGKMTHRFYQWPIQRGRAMADIAKIMDSDRRIEVFYCPLLRDSPERSASNAPTNVRLVWTDIDKSLTDAQREMLTTWGARVVNSGTGGNAHVYFKVGRELTAGEHRGINIALKKLLGGDPKLIASNALLRIPGTVNHKVWGVGADNDRTGRVTVAVPSTRVVSVDRLCERLTAENGAPVDTTGEQVRVTNAGWKKVDVKPLLRRGSVRSLVRMGTDEAIDRWGKRYQAVNAVVGELVDMGLTDDQIHTLMDEFPPAVEKENDERGYDVHKDIARVLIKRLDDDISGDDSDGLFEAVPETGLSDAAWKVVQRMRADREARAFISGEAFLVPPDDVTWSAADALSTPPKEKTHLINGIAGANHNVLVTAQYKTGKTTMTVANLVRSICDGTKFLDEFTVNRLGSGGSGAGTIVGHWNIEMDPDELLDDYIRPAEFKQPNNLYVANLRGYSVNLTSDRGKEWAVEWLSSRGVRVWTIDSLARIARMAGLNENDNGEMLTLLNAIDEIKQQADVNVTFIITHTGRAAMEEGNERTRGATAVDDWCDARWIMTRDGSLTYLAVDGRGVRLPTTRINFDETSRRYTMGVGGKVENQYVTLMDIAVKLVMDAPGKLNTRMLKKEMTRMAKVGDRSQQKIQEAIQEAVEMGSMIVRTGMNRQKFYFPPDADTTGVTDDFDAREMGMGKRADGSRLAPGRKSKNPSGGDAQVLELDFGAMRKRGVGDRR